MDAGLLVNLLSSSIAANQVEMKAAEAQLSQFENQSAGSMLVHLVNIVFSSEQTVTVRQAAAIYSKNLLKRRWVVKSEDEASLQWVPLEAGLRRQVRSVLIEATCGSGAAPLPRQIQTQVNAIISYIAECDFPREWPELLPSLVKTLSGAPSNELRLNALTVACSVLKKYKTAARSTEVLRELQYILSEFQEIHLQLFASVLPQILGSSPQEVMVSAMENVLEIFASLNVVDIPEYYQDNLQTWMGGFFKLLLQPPEFPQTLKNLTCENLALYADKYQEVFEPYVTEAVTCVWTTLLGLNGDDDNKNDAIISSGIKFLSSAANTRWSNSPFENQEALRHIVEKLIIPNIQLRDADVELFTDNPDDYIRKDLENADAETRRRSAVDLVRALSKFYEAKVTPILLEYVGKLFSSNHHLRSKDAGVQLVIAMAAKGETRAQGVSVVNDKIDINEFFKSQVLLTDELSGLVGVALDEDKAVLKSSCLKFLILFRNKLDRNLVIESLVKIISNLITNLTTATALNSSSKVLVSYAAHCAYLLLGIVSEEDLALPNKDIAIENAVSLIFASKEQNEYLIKLVFKLLKKKETAAADKSSILKKLVSLMEGFSSNPVNAVFTHFLFESIGESLPLSQDKTSLINPLCQILERNVTEYIPYALQVLALLIESPSSSPVQVFVHLFPLLLNESLWKNPSLIPGLARILAAYVFVPAYATLVLANLVHVTERFKILLNSNKFEQTAFDIANCIVVNPHLGIIPNEFLKVIILAVLTKIHLKRSDKLLKQLSILLACAIANSPHAEQLIAVIETIQPGIASQVVKDLWMNSVATLNINLMTPKLRKLFFLSLPKLLNSQFIQSNPVLMQSVLSACETMICVNPSKAATEAGFAPAAAQDTANAEDAHEFEVSYSKLGSTLNLVTENDFLPHVTGDGLAAFKHALKSLPSGALQANPSLANWASS